MNYILLTGAGFSRNWGGWLADECFEYLLSCSEITPVIRRELWKSKSLKLGFENTLQELRALHAKHQDERHRNELSVFEQMLEGMFHTMRIGFERIQFEPSHDTTRVGVPPISFGIFCVSSTLSSRSIRTPCLSNNMAVQIYSRPRRANG